MVLPLSLRNPLVGVRSREVTDDLLKSWFRRAPRVGIREWGESTGYCMSGAPEDSTKGKRAEDRNRTEYPSGDDEGRYAKGENGEGEAARKDLLVAAIEMLV